MEQPLARERPLALGSTWRPGITFALLLSYFALFGIVIGAQGVLWADIKATLRLSEGVFGTVQLASPLISVGLLLMGGQLSAWAGKKRLAIVSLALLAGGIVALAQVGSLWGLIGALMLAGGANGLLEMAMNGATLDWERATGRSVMNVMHAGFSGGAVIGALGAGLLLGWDWTYVPVLLLLAALCGVALVASVPVRYPPVEHQSGEVGGLRDTLRLLWSRRSFVILALICVLGIVGESVAFLWMVIYLRELGAPSIISGAAFSLFNAAMFLGRLLNAPLVERKGARASLILSGVALLLATVMLVPSGGVPLAVAAFVLLGLAVAGVVPTVLVVAAERSPGNSGAVAGGIMASAYAGFIVCPPLIGWVAEAVSLKVALVGILGLSGVALLWLVREVELTRR